MIDGMLWELEGIMAAGCFRECGGRMAVLLEDVWEGKCHVVIEEGMVRGGETFSALKRDASSLYGIGGMSTNAPFATASARYDTRIDSPFQNNTCYTYMYFKRAFFSSGVL